MLKNSVQRSERWSGKEESGEMGQAGMGGLPFAQLAKTAVYVFIHEDFEPFSDKASPSA
jgi:hypothetical protein